MKEMEGGVLESIDIRDVLSVAMDAGRAIMEIYEKDFAVEYEEDDSPLTETDKAAHRIIEEGLNAIEVPMKGEEGSCACLPVLSEEGAEIPYEVRKNWEYFWMIDPLDGTKEFVKKNGEFTVNIALIYRDTLVLGVFYAPALGEIYWAKSGEGAWKAPVERHRKILDEGKKRLPDREKIRHRKEKGEWVVVASKSHLNEETKAYIDRLTADVPHPVFISRGSSLKLLMVAEGSADAYPRLAPTMEWDTTAADAIVREAGAILMSLGKHSPFLRIKYNKNILLNEYFVVQRVESEWIGTK